MAARMVVYLDYNLVDMKVAHLVERMVVLWVAQLDMKRDVSMFVSLVDYLVD